jgi:hypothetical protein
MNDNPKLEEKWGPYECPYPNAKFTEIIGVLKVGVIGALFVHPEKAVANLVAAGWRDKELQDVVVILPGTLSMNRFHRMLMGVLKVMKMDEEIIKREDKIELTNGKKCWIFPAQEKTFRGLSTDVMIFCNVPESTWAPLLVKFGCVELLNVLFFLDVLFDKEYERRQAIKKHEGPWNATFKLNTLDILEKEEL